jgi:DNA-binding CsgD family transcriptional regulator
LETVRQYALEKLGQSGEADAVRSRHRDYYTELAALLDTPGRTDYEQRIEQAEAEIDNLRGAFGWSCENSDSELALALASSLQPLWLARGRIQEGLAWFHTNLADLDAQHREVAAAVRARALADNAVLGTWLGAADSPNDAQQALALARDIDDPALLARVLTACGLTAGQSAEAAAPYFAEAIGLARPLGDPWRLSQILAWQAYDAVWAGDPIRTRAASEEGRDLADAIGDRFASRQCRYCLGIAQLWGGDPAGALAQFAGVAVEAEAAHDLLYKVWGLGGQGFALGWQGDMGAARAAAAAAIDAASELGGNAVGNAYSASAVAALAAGDVEATQDVTEAAWKHMSGHRANAAVQRAFRALATLAGGDLVAARRWADAAVTTTTGWHLMHALTARARVAIAQGEPERAERDTYHALACAVEVQAPLGISDTLECLATLAADAGGHCEAARLFGAAQAIRERMGVVRFNVWDAGYEASVAALREAMGEEDFDGAWSEGAALSTEEAIAYAERGHGERKRPTSGWASLTPAEREVVRLVSEGLANKDIATRLFVSPRTVQAHLTHVYTKLGLTSRVQLVQEAARHC